MRAAQSESSRELVQAAQQLLGLIDQRGTRGDAEDSPGRRPAVAAGMDRDEPRRPDRGPTPGQRAAARAHAQSRRGTAGDAFDRLDERGI
jgi:hypothetical protein